MLVDLAALTRCTRAQSNRLHLVMLPPGSGRRSSASKPPISEPVRPDPVSPMTLHICIIWALDKVGSCDMNVPTCDKTGTELMGFGYRPLWWAILWAWHREAR